MLYEYLNKDTRKQVNYKKCYKIFKDVGGEVILDKYANKYNLPVNYSLSIILTNIMKFVISEYNDNCFELDLPFLGVNTIDRIKLFDQMIYLYNHPECQF